MESVFRRGVRHWMGVQRYDAPDPRNPGAFIYKVWTPVNSPIKERKKTVAVLHHVQDVTRVVPATPPHVAYPQLSEFRRGAEALSRQFPSLPADAVLGVLTHSHSVVMENAGAPDFERAEELARLRLETHAGHSADNGWTRPAHQPFESPLRGFGLPAATPPSTGSTVPVT